MTALHHIPLNRAYLCADLTCQAVGDSANWCPACSGSALISLAKLLNRAQQIAQDAPKGEIHVHA